MPDAKGLLILSRIPLLFTAQPEAPANTKAGDCGWAANDSIDSPLTRSS